VEKVNVFCFHTQPIIFSSFSRPYPTVVNPIQVFLYPSRYSFASGTAIHPFCRTSVFAITYKNHSNTKHHCFNYFSQRTFFLNLSVLLYLFLNTETILLYVLPFLDYFLSPHDLMSLSRILLFFNIRSSYFKRTFLNIVLPTCL
jgi:hypothetical protein